MSANMRRREFITLLGGAAVAWPLAARAQQTQRMRRIGVLVNLPADDPQAQVRNAALLQGLQELGWTVGRNVRIDFRWGAGNAERIRRDAEAAAAGDARCADRVRPRRRSGRRRLRREPRAPRREYHRIY
jgi:hypothetical protein